MSCEIYPTTALHIVGAVDCASFARGDTNCQLVASFLDIVGPQAENALLMAEALGFMEKNGTMQGFRPKGLLPQMLISANNAKKPAVVRFALEQFEPFTVFTRRLAQQDSAQDAARAVKALFALPAHRNEIASTLTDLGTFSNALRLEAGGLLLPKSTADDDYLSVTAEVLDDRQSSLLFVTRRLGKEAADWVDHANVLHHLVMAYQRAAIADEDSRAPVVHAANALESFLDQIGQHYGVPLNGATGINAKADRLYQANPRRITTKHVNLLKYLGHTRNATDHGADAETGQTWDITDNTAREYVHVAMTAISSIVSLMKNRYQI